MLILDSFEPPENPSMFKEEINAEFPIPHTSHLIPNQILPIAII